jgi:hypothetical protein
MKTSRDPSKTMYVPSYEPWSGEEESMLPKASFSIRDIFTYLC